MVGEEAKETEEGDAEVRGRCRGGEVEGEEKEVAELEGEEEESVEGGE